MGAAAFGLPAAKVIAALQATACLIRGPFVYARAMTAAPARFVGYNYARKWIAGHGMVPGRKVPGQIDRIHTAAMSVRNFVVCHNRFPPALSGFVE